MRTIFLCSCCLLLAVAASSQVRNSAPMQKGPAATPSQNQSAVRVQASMEALRKSILQARPTSTGPRVTNPRAATARNAMLAVLGRQKQSATEERAKFISVPKVHIKTAESIQVLPHTTTPAGGSTNVKVVPHTTTPAGGTEIQVQPGVHGPPPQNNKIDPSLCSPRGISAVNRQAKDVVFTPDPRYNLYTISGCQFGDQQGEAHIYGHFKSQIIKMNVEFWSDTSIVAAVDPNVTGELDQDSGVTLVVKPVATPQMQLGGFRFYALRETVQLPSVPRNDFNRPIALPPGMGSFNCQMDSVDFSSPAGNATAHVVRTGTHGLPRGLCANSTVDMYMFDDLAPGFTTDSFQYSYTEITQNQCTAEGVGQGALTYAGNWDAQFVGDNIRLSFRVQDCSSTLMTKAVSVDASVYWLTVWVTGPKGLSPRS
jgi:hypothetical protein